MSASSTPSTLDFTAIHGVILDFDGVILDSEVAVYEEWKAYHEANGSNLPLDLYGRCVGSDHATWDPKRHFEEQTGWTPDWENASREVNVRIRQRLEGAGPMPGVTSLMDHWRGEGLPIAVASSSNHAWVDGWLERLGLADHVVSTHCREDVDRVKPAPDLFHRAAASLDIDPAALLVVEDSHNGVKAARAAGLAVVAVPNSITREQDFRSAGRVLPNMHALLHAWRQERR